MSLNLLAFTVKAIGVLMVAGLLWPLTRAVPNPFFRRWAVGWTGLAVAMVAARVTMREEPLGSVSHAVVLTTYCLGWYTFAYLAWVGYRECGGGRPPHRRDLWVLLPAAGFALVAPWQFSALKYVFPFHCGIVAGFLLLALAAAHRVRPPSDHLPVGLLVSRVGLLSLAVSLGHYLPVGYWAHYLSADPPPVYFTFTPVVNVFLELVLAFGMVVLATERIRDELATANRRLREASRQLTEVARTDALTGLLNRTAFEHMLTEKAGTRFTGCLAVLDLNDLKRLNDRHLHAAGDAALKIVARALRNKFRVTDPLFRVGGDEFVVLVPNGTPTDLTARLTAADGDLTDQRIPGVDGPTTLCVAWGVSAFASGDDLSAAYQRADRDMYTDKARRKHGADSGQRTADRSRSPEPAA